MMLALSATAHATFVSSKDFDFKKLLVQPPALDSDDVKKEIEQMLKLQAQRTDEQITRIKSESKMTPFIFSQSLGSWFNPDDLPVTAGFLDKVLTDAKSVCSSSKEVFNRTRPFVIDDRLKPVSDKEKSSSYPSSHSTRAMVLALTLAEMLPDQKMTVIAQGRLIGDDRVVAGQHFPSDVAAGRILAKAIFEKMLQNPDFQAELAKAKQECLAKEPKEPVKK